jgi:hypothetical protein
LKQAPSRDELTSTRRQADELRGQLGEAIQQLKVSRDLVGRLEVQLKQRPGLSNQEAKGSSRAMSTTPSCEGPGCSGALSPRADPGAGQR